ncbi:MAG: hypothetical protein AMXMBFR66_14600 [Pseudomonadota bacterium]|nr:hypothetical protein [Rubrivivax sp.]
MPQAIVHEDAAGPARRRPVRAVEIDAARVAAVDDGIAAIYAGRCDLIVARGAFDAAILGAAGERLDAEASALPWARPNLRAPLDDVHLLGTDAPATPTFQAPRGVALDEYLERSRACAADAATVFPPGFDAEAALRTVLARFAGGRAVEVARADDGRRFVAFTIRRLVDGTQLSIHHDLHYELELYRELARRVDTRTLVSFVATLRAPLAGGELVVYGARSDEPGLPRVPGGHAFDLAAIEERYERHTLRTGEGDLFLLAAGRCLHRVGRVVGPRSRITMGGFLALDARHERVLFWS